MCGGMASKVWQRSTYRALIDRYRGVVDQIKLKVEGFFFFYWFSFSNWNKEPTDSVPFLGGGGGNFQGLKCGVCYSPYSLVKCNWKANFWLLDSTGSIAQENWPGDWEQLYALIYSIQNIFHDWTRQKCQGSLSLRTIKSLHYDCAVVYTSDGKHLLYILEYNRVYRPAEGICETSRRWFYTRNMDVQIH